MKAGDRLTSIDEDHLRARLHTADRLTAAMRQKITDSSAAAAPSIGGRRVRPQHVERKAVR